MEKKIPLLLIEANRLLREGIASGLNQQPGLKVVAACAGGEAALWHLRETKPKVVLVDESLGHADTLRLVASIKEASPDVYVIVLAFVTAREDVVEFMKLGVSGFIARDATIEAFAKTIRLVTAGRRVLPRSLTDVLFSQVAEQAFREKEAQLNGKVHLTPREREIMAMIQHGLSNREVGQRLHIATDTVKAHVHNILRKLDLRTRAQIAAYAVNTSAKLAGPPVPHRPAPAVTLRA